MVTIKKLSMCFDQGEKSIIIYENFHYITSFHINRPKWYHKGKVWIFIIFYYKQKYEELSKIYE